jgi:diaminopimelate decarboxylase
MTEAASLVPSAHPAAGPSGSPWPASATFGAQGLVVAGLRAADLAERFGTPLLVVDEEDLRERCRAARAFAPRVLYAVKAFTAHAVVRIALEEGLDLLAASGGEVQACLRAGASGSRLVLHGNNKSDDELALAVASGISLVIADGLDELGRIDEAARSRDAVQPVLLRVIPEVDAHTHASIATGHIGAKFGTPRAEAVDAVRALGSLPGVRFDGLHAHVGSQVSSVEPYLRCVDALIDVATRLRDDAGVVVGTLDVGGGFAVTYVDQPGLDPGHVTAAVSERMRERCAAAGLPTPGLIVEPGRALVANPVLTLYRVGTTKRVGGRVLVAVDGGMSDNLRPMLYDARFSVAAAGPPSGSRSVPVSVVGKHCETGDTLAEDVLLPADLARGDLVAFAATGAYTYGMASTYNRVGRPAVVGVREGDATLLLRREDAADLDRLETAAYRRVPVDAPPPAGVIVRAARPGDVAAFLTFWRAIVGEGRYVRSETVTHPPREYRRRFRHAWTDDEAQIVAMDGTRVVGHVSLQREQHPVSRHVATLGIAVAGDARGQGVGSALMARGLAWARGSGVEKLVLSVYPNNVGAIALYHKFGFVDEGRLTRRSRKSYGYEDEVMMGAWIGAGSEGRAASP